ncbi:cation H(+) antiporter 15-like protein, partial [Trifolium pratense]
MDTSTRGNGTISVIYDTHGRWEICVKNDRNVGSYGIFLGDNPFDFALPATLFQLIIIILISQTLYFLLRPLRTPKFICSVLGGIILGPSCLGRYEVYWKSLFPPRQADVLFVMSIVGAIYFLFFIALKMDVIMTIRAAKSTWRLDTSRSSLSATIAFSNFPVVSDALAELNLLATELGQIALSSATLNDCITDLIGVTFLIGPLIYGLVIPSGPPLGTTLVDKCEVIISEILLPFFFVCVGMSTNLSALNNWREFATLQFILIAGDVAKVVACVLVSMTYNIKATHGIVLGLMLNIKGITHLIAFSKLKKVKLLDDDTYSHLVICVAVTTSVITPFVKILYKHRPRVLNSSTEYYDQMKTIQNSPRNSEFRIITCLHSEGNVRGITTLLEACNPAPESPLCVFVIHLIELLGKSAPILLPINYKQNRKFLSVNYPDTNYIVRAFENYAKNSYGPVIVLPYVNVAPYKSMLDAVCNLSQDKMVPLIVIPFHENDNIELGGHVSSSIRKLNTRFQARVPCTLGILVDRYSQLGSSQDHMKNYFHVGIFFVGGADDREALALGIRMSQRVNMKVSLFRFIVMNRKEYESKTQPSGEDSFGVEEQEEMLDEGLIDEFKSMKFGSGSVSWYEIVVEDGVEIIDAIRGLEGNYDLVMVGKRHNVGSLKDEEMGNFIENVQILGIFGDMLSSTEFCIGTVPVLVTQCGRDKRVFNKLDRV